MARGVDDEAAHPGRQQRRAGVHLARVERRQRHLPQPPEQLLPGRDLRATMEREFKHEFGCFIGFAQF